MTLLTLFARQEPTTDAVVKQYAPDLKKHDTVFYKDARCKKLYARIPWHHADRPVHRKSVTLNGYNWNIKWV